MKLWSFFIKVKVNTPPKRAAKHMSQVGPAFPMTTPPDAAAPKMAVNQMLLGFVSGASDVCVSKAINSFD